MMSSSGSRAFFRADGFSRATGSDGRPVVAQDAEPGAADRRQHVLALVVDVEGVLAVAEEGEVVVRPATRGTGPSSRPPPAAMPFGGASCSETAMLLAPLAHLAPVLDGVADVAEDGAQLGGDRLAVLRRGHAVDLEVHPRLGDDAELVRRPVCRRRRSPPGSPTASRRTTSCGWTTRWTVRPSGAERGGDRVDEERHVVGDDLDDGVPAGPALRLHASGSSRRRWPCRPAAAARGRARPVRPRAGPPARARAGPRSRCAGRTTCSSRLDLLPGLLGGVLGGGAQLLGPGLLERRRHGLVRVPSSDRRGHASSGAVSRVSPLFTCWTTGRACEAPHVERGGERRGGMRRSAYRGTVTMPSGPRP